MSIFKKHSRKDVVRAIEAHEVGPYKDTKEGWPYIFTGVSRRKDPSSAFGPRQITYSTVKNAVANYKDRGNKLSPELQAYADKLIAQGMNKVNLDKGAAKFYSDAGIGVEREATAEDRASFGSFGTGFIPREDHEKYYDEIADIVFDEKLKEAEALGVTDVNGFLRVYHGSKNPENNLDYQDKVNRYLEDPSLIDRKPGLFGMGMVIPGTRIGFNEGGDVSMQKQMELFDEGGLMDEGGTTDPVSGNDVPVGSLQKEVRDDVPAQLSEGEFVMPADVVRYHGLDKMMALRDEAKAGLARMEAMGQMGNADEATIPDGIPFNMDDLIMDDEPVEMQVGGFIQPTGFAQIQQTAPIQQRFSSPYAILPPPQQTQTPLTAEQLVPRIETEFRTYVNAQGQTLQIPFINGQPVYPIPPGYTLQLISGPQEPVQQPAEAPAQPVQQDDPSDEPSTAPAATAVFGGTVSDGRIFGGTTYEVSYDSSGTSAPGILGALTGRVDRVTLTRDGKQATMSRDLYNRLKEDRTSSETTQIINQLFNYTDAANQSINQSAGLDRGFLGFGGNRKELENNAAREIYEDLGLEYKNQPLSEALMVQAETEREEATTAQSTAAPTPADIDYEGVVAGEAARMATPKTADGIGTGPLPSATLTTTSTGTVNMEGGSRSTPIGTGRAATEGDIARLFGQTTTADGTRLDPMGIGFPAGTRLTGPEERLSDSTRMEPFAAPKTIVQNISEVPVITVANMGGAFRDAEGRRSNRYAQIGDDLFRFKRDGTLASEPARNLDTLAIRNDGSSVMSRTTSLIERPVEMSTPMARPTDFEREIGMRLTPAQERILKDERRMQQLQTTPLTSFEVQAMADRDDSPSLTPAEIDAMADRDFSDARQAEIDRERAEAIIAEESRRQQSQTDTDEADRVSAREGRSNIVTDSSGRPVTSRSTGRAVTTARGQKLRESGSSGDAAIERQADAMRREANRREEEQRAERNRQEMAKQSGSTQASSPGDKSRAGEDGGGGDPEPSGGTYCCTASWKRNQMTITEIKALRKWHRQQSSMWQEGYDIWGKWVADNLVAKSDWSASVVKDVYEAFINKRYTAKGLIGLSVIIPGVYATAIYRRIRNNGRVTCTNQRALYVAV